MARPLLTALACWFVFANLLAFIAFGRDKSLARRGRYRIPEARLLLYAAMGGAIGALLGMRCFRHKTRKLRFRIMTPLILCLHIALGVLLFLSLR